MGGLYLAFLGADAAYRRVSPNSAEFMKWAYGVDAGLIAKRDLHLRDIPSTYLDRHIWQFQDTLEKGDTTMILPGCANDPAIWYSRMTVVDCGVHWGLIRMPELADQVMSGLTSGN